MASIAGAAAPRGMEKTIMSEAGWKQAMDGSPAEVDLFDAVANNPKIDGEAGRAYWELLSGRAEWGHVAWQHGPIQEVGRNGILLEELLEHVVIPRLQGFNRDRIPDPNGRPQGPDGDVPTIPNPFRNRETSLAITHLEEALHWLKHRTALRRKQGVEGTFQPHIS